MNYNRVAIRVDASYMLGLGHLMRCITLGKQLLREGIEVVFICRVVTDEINQLLLKENFIVETLSLADRHNVTSSVEQNIELLKENNNHDAKATIQILSKYSGFDWLVVDHYALDQSWEKKIAQFVGRIMIIDDLANREHYGHILLDQNYHINMKERYVNLVPSECKLFLGPSHVLLRDEFLDIDFKNCKRSGKLNNVFVFFGGSDPTNETEKVIRAIQQWSEKEVVFHIVVGAANERKAELKVICEDITNVCFYNHIDYMAKLMGQCDLAIGAGGATTWERCYLGLPSLIIILAENQRPSIENLSELEAYINLGWHENVSVEHIIEKLSYYKQYPEQLIRMSNNAKNLMSPEAEPTTDSLISYMIK